MAGMLPGVECARRRRFHGSNVSSDSSFVASNNGSSRRFSLCLHTTSYESNNSSYTSSQRSESNQGYDNKKETLVGIAREAKERLEQRLRTPGKSDTQTQRRNRKQEGCVRGEMDTEIYGTKKKKKKGLLSWAKQLQWKASDQDECVVCLERFKVGETLVHLPCAHKFHNMCVSPWLATNAHCPCCRTQIL